jgi:Gram-negative bacterial TonB protein C-terminal
MLRTIRAIIAIIAASASQLVFAKSEPLVLKPTSAWHLDYGKDSCRMARQFGEGDKQVLVIFNRYGPGEPFRLIVSGAPFKVSSPAGIAKVQFGPNEEVQSISYSSGSFDKLPALVFDGSIRIAPLTPAELKIQIETYKLQKSKPYLTYDPVPINELRQKAVKYLEIGKSSRQTIRLEIGSMRASLAALEKCSDELTMRWGIDYEKHKNLQQSARPANFPGSWVTTNDYPSNMITAAQPANVVFRLDISADGKPTGCHIQATTQAKEFDDAVCGSILKRARFTPALDAEGKPIASYYINQVNFRLPY